MRGRPAGSRRGLLAALTLGALAAGGTLWAGRAALGPGLAALEGWREGALSAPDGRATGDVFAAAVAGEAIVWDPATQSVTLRRERAEALPQTVAEPLLRLGESSVAIRAELDRLSVLGRYAAIRARCTGGCAAPDWSLALAGDTGTGASTQAAAQGMARAAARIRRDLPAPLPRTHFALADTEPGWSDWLAFSAEAAVMVTVTGSAIDALEIVGGLASVPEGWLVTARFCRDPASALGPCAEGQPVAATRLQRAGGALAVEITPLSLTAPGVSDLALSDRVRLDCTESCQPRWVAATTPRRYASPAPDTAPGTVSRPTPPHSGAELFLGPWVMRSDRGLVPSAMARDLGAQAVLGESPQEPGSLLAGSAGLPAGTPLRVTLDPAIQAATQAVLEAMVRPGAADPFAADTFSGVPRRFAPGGPRASLVVLDLRNPGQPGAIRAAVGLPAPPPGRSDWGLAAIAHDPGARFAPGAAAWTGRRWHQIPGSAWKIFSALALIEALDTGLADIAGASDLHQLLDGVTRPEADALLGPGALSGVRGLCIPRALTTPLQGAGAPDCPEDFYPRPVADSGRAGPLAADDSARFGLVEALARSSNIWFAAVTLHSEAVSSSSPAARLSQRLGLDRPAPLDAGQGLDLWPRDAARIDALDPGFPAGDHVRALASGAFGQQVQAGPLVLAQLAGSVRLNRGVAPSLVDPPAPAGPLYQMPHSLQRLEQLRDGLRAVTAPDRQGTARAVFARHAPELAGRTGGKTGTAERGLGEDRISTFAGWLDAPGGTPGFAIGCAITLQGAPRAEPGLEVPPLCAHMVAALMDRLDREVLR